MFKFSLLSIAENLICDEECIGGCTSPLPNGCRLCRNFRTIDADNMCVSQCPGNLFALSSLCISADFCKSLHKKPIFGECRDSCPLIITEKNVNISSPDQCARECPGTEVESLATSDLVISPISNYTNFGISRTTNKRFHFGVIVTWLSNS